MLPKMDEESSTKNQKKTSQEAIPRNEKQENGGRVWVIWKGATNLKFEMDRPEL